jgi:hypothetical protein
VTNLPTRRATISRSQRLAGADDRSDHEPQRAACRRRARPGPGGRPPDPRPVLAGPRAPARAPARAARRLGGLVPPGPRHAPPVPGRRPARVRRLRPARVAAGLRLCRGGVRGAGRARARAVHARRPLPRRGGGGRGGRAPPRRGGARAPGARGLRPAAARGGDGRARHPPRRPARPPDGPRQPAHGHGGVLHVDRPRPPAPGRPARAARAPRPVLGRGGGDGGPGARCRRPVRARVLPPRAGLRGSRRRAVGGARRARRGRPRRRPAPLGAARARGDLAGHGPPFRARAPAGAVALRRTPRGPRAAPDPPGRRPRGLRRAAPAERHAQAA